MARGVIEKKEQQLQRKAQLAQLSSSSNCLCQMTVAKEPPKNIPIQGGQISLILGAETNSRGGCFNRLMASLWRFKANVPQESIFRENFETLTGTDVAADNTDAPSLYLLTPDDHSYFPYRLIIWGIHPED